MCRHGLEQGEAGHSQWQSKACGTERDGDSGEAQELRHRQRAQHAGHESPAAAQPRTGERGKMKANDLPPWVGRQQAGIVQRQALAVV